MKTTSNKDMLNAIRNQASEEYKEKMPVMTSDEDIMAIAAVKLQEYPSIKNEFINTLANKVVKTEFFSRVYENPLKMLKKGMLPYGNTIEELFVKHATAKGFYKDNAFHGTNEAGQAASEQTTVGDLIGKKKADISALYVSRNFAYVFDVSISDAQLKSAFFNQNGLSELVNQLVGSLASGAELQEYKDMIGLLKCAAAGVKVKTDAQGKLDSGDSYITAGSSSDFLGKNGGVKNAMHVEMVTKGGDTRYTNGYSHNLAKKLRATAQKLKFMNSKYNMAGVETFSRLEDLVFVTTPDHMAEMDVETLASAFNISHAEAQIRTIVVDELPKCFAHTLNASAGTKPDQYWTTSGGQNSTASSNNNLDCLGILMDVNFLQVIDTVNESRQFDNGRNLMTNLFLHKQGIMANCYFANAVAFVAQV